MYKFFATFKVYFFVVLIIGSWWSLAFRQKQIELKPAGEVDSLHPSNNLNQKKHIHTFVHIDRDMILHALAGNTTLMSQLIAEWDIEEQIAQADGHHEVKRLPQKTFLRSQWIERQLRYRSTQELEELKASMCPSFLVDNAGKRIDLDRNFNRFLPQTYSVASFLLAIVPTEKIIALPRRLRDQEQIYPKSLTDRISLDIDRYNSEKLFQAEPEIAFVANYSHPATLQALTNQGVIIYTMKTPSTIADITEELINIGYILRFPLEAELLKIFIEASILAIDNQLEALTLSLRDNHRDMPRVLYLNFNQSFSIPTSKNLTGQLLTKFKNFDISLKYVQDHQKEQEWTIPIDKEHVINLNPDCVIISAENSRSLEIEFFKDFAFQQISAFQKHHVYFVDQAIQQSPSQYIVLSYYDLYQAISNLL